MQSVEDYQLCCIDLECMKKYIPNKQRVAKDFPNTNFNHMFISELRSQIYCKEYEAIGVRKYCNKKA